MNVQTSKLFLTISAAAIFGLNVSVKAEEPTSSFPAFTNAVAVFINALSETGFSLRPASFACGNWITDKNDTTKTISGADFFFERNNDVGIAVKINYSEINFLAANTYTNLLLEILSSGRLPPLNTTYQTDFVVLSHYDSGIATKHSSVVLISTNLVADISTSSETGDSSQDMLQVIKKVETMRDVMNIKEP